MIHKWTFDLEKSSFCCCFLVSNSYSKSSFQKCLFQKKVCGFPAMPSSSFSFKVWTESSAAKDFECIGKFLSIFMLPDMPEMRLQMTSFNCNWHKEGHKIPSKFLEIADQARHRPGVCWETQTRSISCPLKPNPANQAQEIEKCEGFCVTFQMLRKKKNEVESIILGYLTGKKLFQSQYQDGVFQHRLKR